MSDLQERILHYVPGMQPQTHRKNKAAATRSATVRAINTYETEALLLSSVAMGQEEVACKILSDHGSTLQKHIIYDTFISAAAHGEVHIIRHIIANRAMRETIPPRGLLNALRMAVIQRFPDVIDALTQDPRWKTVVNYSGEQCPHILALALEDPDYNFVAKVAELPYMDIPEDMIASAEARRRSRIAEMLKDAKKRKEKDALKQKRDRGSDAEIYEIQTDLDLTANLPYAPPIGPNAQASIERKKRERWRERVTSMSA